MSTQQRNRGMKMGARAEGRRLDESDVILMMGATGLLTLAAVRFAMFFFG